MAGGLALATTPNFQPPTSKHTLAPRTCALRTLAARTRRTR